MEIIMVGADDPEMRANEKLLIKAHKHIVYASSGGKRVSPGSAYRADPISGLKLGDTLVRIECEPIFVPDGVNVVVIDHHRPGDPGFDMGPEKFWEASSIGQLHRFLNVEPTDWRKMIAAMDHCLSAAMRGECPGISGGEVALVAVMEIAASTNTGQVRVIQQIHDFAKLLKKSPHVMVGAQEVKDLRNIHLGQGYSRDLLTAQLAAAMEGHAVLFRHRDIYGTFDKCSITGHAKPETIEVFMKEWAPAQGFQNIYGVPHRGYGGGYLPHPAK